MRRRPVSRAAVLAATLLVLATTAAPSRAQVTLREDGFRVRVFDTCADFPGPAFYGIVDAACGEGTGFGDYVYYTVQFPEDEFLDHLERISMNGRVESWGARMDFPGRMVLSPAASFIGERLIVDGLCDALSPQAVYTPEGAIETCLAAGEGPASHSAFDPSGLFGYFWYENTGLEIAVFDDFGSVVGFSPTRGPGEIRFGPGGAWGRSLYVAGGGTVDPNGSLTAFPFPITQWAWPEGAGWDGDMIDACGPGQLCRVRPDGSFSVFASDVPGGALVGCGGHLWIMRAEGCLRITPRRGRAETAIIPSRVRLTSDGRSFSIRTSLTDADTGQPLDPALLEPAWISRLVSPALGEIVLPVPSAEPGCDDVTDDGIWESIESRTITGAGSVTLRFNTPSDGLCETRDGDLGDLLPLIQAAPAGEQIAICYSAISPEVAVPVEGCGYITVQAGRRSGRQTAAQESRRRRMDPKRDGSDLRREAP